MEIPFPFDCHRSRRAQGKRTFKQWGGHAPPFVPSPEFLEGSKHELDCYRLTTVEPVIPKNHSQLPPCHTSLNLETVVGSQKSAQALGAPGKIQKCLITTEVTTTFCISPCTPISYTAVLRPTAVSRLKKGVSLRQGYGRQASGVPCLRRSGFAQAGRPFVVLTYSRTLRTPNLLRRSGYEGRERLRPC